MNMIPHSRPWLDTAEIRAASAVIRSGYLAQGKAVLDLEGRFSKMNGHPFSVAVSSGSAGLFLAFKALGIGKGDKVILPTYACTALLNAVRLAEASPVLADVDAQTGNVTVHTIKKALRSRTKAVVVVHLWGNPAAAAEIEQEFGIPVVEDCAQAIGAQAQGVSVGGQTAISLFSFYTTKMLAAGEGGILCTSNQKVAASIRSWREYDNAEDLRPCFNFKWTDLQAAIVAAQLGKLNRILLARRKIAEFYNKNLADLKMELPFLQPNTAPAFYRYVIQSEKNPQKVIARASKLGVSMARPIYRPLHRYLNQSGFPHADRMYDRAVSIPIYPSLKSTEMRRVESVIREIWGS